MPLPLVRCFNCQSLPELYNDEDCEPWLWQVQCMVCGTRGPAALSEEAAVIAWNAAEIDKMRRATYDA